MGDGGIGLRTAIAGPNYPIGSPGPGPSTGGWLAGGGGGSCNGGPGGDGGAGGGGAGDGPGNGGTNPLPQSQGQASTGGLLLIQVGGPFGYQGGSGIVVVRYQIGAIQSSSVAKATGGSVSFYSGKTIHAFTHSGSFTNTSGSPLSIDYVMVAGGAAGQTDAGGGGGAGGVLTNIPGLMPVTQLQYLLLELDLLMH